MNRPATRTTLAQARRRRRLLALIFVLALVTVLVNRVIELNEDGYDWPLPQYNASTR